jgi:hypothetical protein
MEAMGGRSEQTSSAYLLIIFIWAVTLPPLSSFVGVATAARTSRSYRRIDSAIGIPGQCFEAAIWLLTPE